MPFVALSCQIGVVHDFCQVGVHHLVAHRGCTSSDGDLVACTCCRRRDRCTRSLHVLSFYNFRTFLSQPYASFEVFRHLPRNLPSWSNLSPNRSPYTPNRMLPTHPSPPWVYFLPTHSKDDLRLVARSPRSHPLLALFRDEVESDVLEPGRLVPELLSPPVSGGGLLWGSVAALGADVLLVG